VLTHPQGLVTGLVGPLGAAASGWAAMTLGILLAACSRLFSDDIH
jgi:hypothetical protein